MPQFLEKSTMLTGLALSELVQLWPKIVGTYMAKHLQPTHLKKDTLFCYTENSALLQELSMIEADVLSKIHTMCPKLDNIRFIKYTSVKPPRPKKEILEQLEDRKARREKHFKVKENVRVPSSLTSQMQYSLNTIDDMETRDKAERFLQALLKRHHALKAAGWNYCKTCKTMYEPHYRDCPYCQQD